MINIVPLIDNILTKISDAFIFSKAILINKPQTANIDIINETNPSIFNIFSTILLYVSYLQR